MRRYTESIRGWRARVREERGQALLETAIVLPIILLISVSIFEFGRAYQTVQVLTNAAREGARVAVLPSSTPAEVQARVTEYLQSGQLPDYASATISVNQDATITMGAQTAGASTVIVQYPFSFIVLNPVARLVNKASTTANGGITLTGRAEMRNEAQAGS